LRIRAAIERLGYSQREVADYLGMHLDDKRDNQWQTQEDTKIKDLTPSRLICPYSHIFYQLYYANEMKEAIVHESLPLKKTELPIEDILVLRDLHLPSGRPFLDALHPNWPVLFVEELAVKRFYDMIHAGF
jgi:transcriptional regulator with XRE-family HTH domain